MQHIFPENSSFEEYLCQISSFYVNLKVVFSYKAHYYMCLYIVWIEIYAQTTVMAAILDLGKLKIPPPPNVFSPTTKLNMVDYITDRGASWTMMLETKCVFKHQDFQMFDLKLNKYA